jgi:hypothetical protein
MAAPIIFGYCANGGEYLFALSGSATSPASRSPPVGGYVFIIGHRLTFAPVGDRESDAAEQSDCRWLDCCGEVA